MPWWKPLSLKASLIRMLACIMYLEAHGHETKRGLGDGLVRAWFIVLLIERRGSMRTSMGSILGHGMVLLAD